MRGDTFITNAFIVTALFIALLALGYLVGRTINVEPESQLAALCEVGYANPDGSVTLVENQAGSTEYTVLATNDGIKVFTLCNK